MGDVSNPGIGRLDPLATTGEGEGDARLKGLFRHFGPLGAGALMTAGAVIVDV